MASVEETPIFTIEKFQGPLDLLLHLIRKEEMNIFDIPIIKLVEQYEEYLKGMKELNLTIASEYIYMLSVLLNIKAKMLIRGESEEKEEDPRAPLVSQLMEYEKIKKLADELKEIYTLWGGAATREDNTEEIFFMEDLNVFQIVEAFNNILKRLKLREKPSFISERRPSIKNMMVNLLNYLPKNGKPLPLFDFLLQMKNRMEVITAFLSVLELIRLGCIKYLLKDRKEEIYLIYLKDLPKDLIFEEYA